MASVWRRAGPRSTDQLPLAFRIVIECTLHRKANGRRRMSNLDRALAEISAIRDQMARATEFRGFGPLTSAMTGVIALAAALGQHFWLPAAQAHVRGWLALWSAAALISAGLIGAEMVTRSRRHHSHLAEDMMRTAIEQFLPAATAGVLLTAVLIVFAPQSLWMLPGLWQILFSLGVFASCRVLPRSIALVGFWYLASGLACLAFAQGGHGFSPWAMGVPFGAGQWLAAVLLQRSLGGRHD
jgi:hypothetical protein